MKLQQERVIVQGGREQLEREQRDLADRVRREQVELEKARDALQLDHRRLTAQVDLERQLLAEERARFDSDRRLGSEQQQRSFLQVIFAVLFH